MRHKNVGATFWYVGGQTKLRKHSKGCIRDSDKVHTPSQKYNIIEKLRIYKDKKKK